MIPAAEEIEFIGGGCGPGSHKDMRYLVPDFPLGCLQNSFGIGIVHFFHETEPGIQQDLDIFITEQAGDVFGDILIFPGEKLAGIFSDDHVRPKSPEHLPEFEADISATDDKHDFPEVPGSPSSFLHDNT